MSFLPPPPHHERGARRSGGVVLAERDAFGIAGRGRDVEPRPPGQFRLLVGRRQPRAVKNGGISVEQRDRRVADRPRRDIGSGEDQRDSRRFVVHVGFSPEAARPDIVAVVAGVDDPGGPAEPDSLQRFQDLADQRVDIGAKAEIGRDRLQTLFRREVAVDLLEVVHALEPGMADIALLRIELAVRQAVQRVEVVNSCGTTSGKCGATNPR